MPLKLILVSIAAIAIMLGSRLLVSQNAPQMLDWPAFELRTSPLNDIDCQAKSVLERQWTPIVGEGDQRFHYQYQCGPATLYLDLVVYLSQEEGHEAISHSSQIIDNTWAYRFGESLIDLPDLGEFEHRRQMLGIENVDAWKTYLVGTVATSQGFSAKFEEAVNHLSFNPQPTTVVSVAVQHPNDWADTGMLLEASARQLLAWYRLNLKSK